MSDSHAAPDGGQKAAMEHVAESVARPSDRWVVLLVQNAAPSERFIGPFTRAEAEAWVGQAVENGVTWTRLVVAPLEVPYGAPDSAATQPSDSEGEVVDGD